MTPTLAVDAIPMAHCAAPIASVAIEGLLPSPSSACNASIWSWKGVSLIEAVASSVDLVSPLSASDESLYVSVLALMHPRKRSNG